MKFGVREICEVVLKAKAAMKVGNKIFYKNEPVCYFDTLKTSSLEGAATTVYAQGGRGNARLMSWDGERTVTWTMEDALISPVGMMILTGAGLIESSEATPIYVHTTEQLQLDDNNFNNGVITLAYDPYDAETGKLDGDYVYIMRLDSNGDIATEPLLLLEQLKRKLKYRIEKEKTNLVTFGNTMVWEKIKILVISIL